jgi:LAO/AO transport system kinase
MVLIEKAAAGDILSISRLMSEVENDTPQGQRALDELYPRGGRAAIIGITGPSGSGKSTLVNRLALTLSSSPEGEAVKVGVIAVDPSSPFSGGALLGDRVRMRDLGTMPNIFIRSMATRGALGGLARAAEGAAQVLDAAGFGIIIVETVGAGQAEVDIARLAHTTVVVEAPGLGDDIQAAKAGILEIADVLAVNKADKPGANATARSLQVMLEIGAEMAGEAGADIDARWHAPLVMTCALDGAGVDELKTAILAHQDWLRTHGGLEARNQTRASDALEKAARERLFRDWRRELDEDAYRAALEDVAARRVSPRMALERLLKP